LKIHDNFSNSSAFHYRSLLLPLLLELEIAVALHASGSAVPDMGNYTGHYQQLFQERVTQEMELVTNAIFTETDDQTAWWYHSFLLEMMVGSMPTANVSPTFVHWIENTIDSDANNLRELAEEAGGRSKWVWLGLYQVLSAKRQVRDQSSSATSAIIDQQRDILRELEVLDPGRRQRYRYLLRRLVRPGSDNVIAFRN
jgi:hypothetical protein